MVTQATTSPKASKNGASSLQDDEFSDFELSLPAFLAGKCEGKVQGIVYDILGPFQGGKNSKIKKEWFAYKVQLTAPCEVVGTDKKKFQAKVGDAIMIPISAHLKNLAPNVIQPGQVWNFQLTPGPQPAPQEMRVWNVRRGRAVPRGNDYPVTFLTGADGKTPLLLAPASGDEVDADDMP